MLYLGQDQLRSKIIADNKCLQIVQYFIYLGREISYEDGEDIQQKRAKFAQMLGILKRHF
jgi:hypothetical protein